MSTTINGTTGIDKIQDGTVVDADLKANENITNIESAVTADSSGNVGIGTDNPTRTFHSKGASGISTVAKLESGMTAGAQQVYLQLSSTGQSDADSGYLRYDNSKSMSFWTADTERMRIDSSGNLLVGTTSNLSTTPKLAIEDDNFVVGISSTNATGELIRFYGNSRSTAGTISHSGTSVAYNTSSDYRLKENVVPMTGSIDRLKALNPSRFNFIADPDTTVDGFLAHEAQEVVPEAVSGDKDAMTTEEYEVTPAVEATYDEDGNELTPAVEAVMGEREVPDMQGIDQAKLVPLLTSALQEAVEKIEALEARVTQLENT